MSGGDLVHEQLFALPQRLALLGEVCAAGAAGEMPVTLRTLMAGWRAVTVETLASIPVS